MNITNKPLAVSKQLSQPDKMRRTAATMNETALSNDRHVNVANVDSNSNNLFSDDKTTNRPYQTSNMHMSNIAGAPNDPFSDECADLFEREELEDVTRFSAEAVNQK